MIFKVPIHREEIGNPLDMYSVNRDITQLATFQKGWKEDKTFGGGGKDFELDLESSELVGGQIMR